ncbi:unnamed protein product [Strongylus vulgaris]|uniref:Uncharacterized protein n=1 Tax=Strongylus vulgaris TaxID=40348 RepID=A0A3P7JUP5_STRVU|nr:unnamed protein product [Strongylus vulgaris]
MCGFSHKTAIKVRLHINIEHDGEGFIKFRDRLNEVERVVMQQLAHECFPALISSPYTSQKHTIGKPHISNSAMEAHQVGVPPLSKSSNELGCGHICMPPIPAHKGDSRDDLKQSATSSSDGFSPTAKNTENFDSDCIIID